MGLVADDQIERAISRTCDRITTVAADGDGRGVIRRVCSPMQAVANQLVREVESFRLFNAFTTERGPNVDRRIRNGEELRDARCRARVGGG